MSSRRRVARCCARCAWAKPAVSRWKCSPACARASPWPSTPRPLPRCADMNRPIHDTPRLGLAGRTAALFQSAQITPLLAGVALLQGLFAVLVTPREEEPQINVTMANVLIPFPGASVADVEQMVATPAEQVLAQMAGTEHVTSVSRPGLAVVTVQFKVGVSRTEALVRLHDTVRSHSDWLPPGLGVLEPLIKPKGIDDVPIVSLTLYSPDPAIGAYDLERVAHSLELELKRVPGTREVRTVGGPGHAVQVQLDGARLAALGVTVDDLRRALQGANQGASLGDLLQGNRALALEAGPYLGNAREVADLVVAVREGRPVFCAMWPSCATARLRPPAWSGMAWPGRARAPASLRRATPQPPRRASTPPSRWPSPKSPARTPSTWPTASWPVWPSCTTPSSPRPCRSLKPATTAPPPTTRPKSSSRSCCSPPPRWWPWCSSRWAGARQPSSAVP